MCFISGSYDIVWEKSTQATLFLTMELHGASNLGAQLGSLGAVMDELANKNERLIRTPLHPGRNPGMIMIDISLLFLLELEINISRVIFYDKT
jgi:hypothetical protein